MFDQLPSELLHSIFLLLSPCDFENVSSVCQRWHAICSEVLKTRKVICSTAYILQAPLRWTVSGNGGEVSRGRISSTPSKRFGSLITQYGDCIYIFGGATHEYTAFNDLWTFDLRDLSWKRLTCEGDVPTPRTYAKGGFIGDTFYMFGGCKSIQSNHWDYAGGWLSDMYSFNPVSHCWSRLTLESVLEDWQTSPQSRPGQSGCILPQGSDGEPGLLILFGGVSTSVARCIDTLYVIAPTRGQFMHVRDPSGMDKPVGRYGHSTCALDACKMLLLFGDSTPPSTRRDVAYYRRNPKDALGETKRRYKGRPAGDIWMLDLHYHGKPIELPCTFFQWTEIRYEVNVPGCPPIDFYHMTATSVPFHDADKEWYTNLMNSSPQCSSSMNSEDGPFKTFNIICISQSTEQYLEDAMKQFRNHQKNNSWNVDANRDVHSNRSMSYKNGIISSLDQAANPSTSSTNSPSSSANPHPSADPCSVSVANSSLPLPSRLSSAKRARQLAALANQERRLFGSRSNSLSATSSADVSMSKWSSTTPPPHPLAVYSLLVEIPTHVHDFDGFPPESRWLIPKRSNYLDFLNAPPECLGFCSTSSHGALFLFGGLSKFDESPDEHNDGGHQSTKMSSSYCAKISQLYILQARALVGTVI